MTEERARYEVEGQEIRPETMLEFSDSGYLKPEADELRALLGKANLTGAQAGDLVGVNGRTIRKWTGDEREIPYAAWRLLLIFAGLVELKAIIWDHARRVGAGPPGNVHTQRVLPER